MTIKTLMLATAVATLAATGAFAQDAMKADSGKMGTGDKMASHDAMATDHMATKPGHKMTKAQMKKHDAMMKHDAMKTDTMKSSTPH